LGLFGILSITTMHPYFFSTTQTLPPDCPLSLSALAIKITF
jgi:hypothetical protein